MAIFVSNLLDNGGLPYQATHAGGEGSFSARVLIPNGTALTDGDFIKFARMYPNIRITEIAIESDDLDGGGSPALAGQLGYVRPVVDPKKALDSTTNPAIDGAVGTDDTDYFVTAGALSLQAGGYNVYAAGQSGLDNEFANVAKVDDVIDLAIEITTTANGAVAADSYVTLNVKYLGLVQNPNPESYTYRGGDDLLD